MTAQGWCPSTFRLFDAPDGGLARVKVPGGILDRTQLQAVAVAARVDGNGTVEITTRANLQIRGVDPASAPALRALLGPVGLSSPTAEIEDRRNVLASPTAGLAVDELGDVGTLVTEIVSALDALQPLGDLSHKFGVLVDGGGSPTLRGRDIDVALGAVIVSDEEGGVIAFELALGDGLPTEPVDRPVAVVDAGDVSAVVAAAARLCAGEEPDIAAGRMSDVVASVGTERTIDAISSLGDLSIFAIPDDKIIRTATSDEPPLGAFESRNEGQWYLGVCPDTTLSADLLDALVDTLAEHGLNEVRLTPWRSIIVPHIPVHDLATVTADLAAAGWSAHSPALAAGASV
jgi:precorrin-3B synthase